jgi:hypothetical protein
MALVVRRMALVVRRMALVVRRMALVVRRIVLERRPSCFAARWCVYVMNKVCLSCGAWSF